MDDKGQAEKPADSRGSGDPSSGGSGGEWKEFILSGSAIWTRMMSRLCGEVSPAKSPDLSAKNRGGRLLGSAAQRNNTPCIRAEVRGVRAADNLESLECVHFGIQRTGPHSPVQGDSQARRVPGGSIVPVVLTAWGGTGSRS